MIIKGEPKSSGYFITAIILLCSVGGLYGLWYALPYFSSWKTEGVIHCDAETVRGKYFVSHGHSFFNANTQSDEAIFTGNFSSKIPTGEGFQFGFGLDFKTFEAGKTYVASVWRKKEYHNGKSELVVIDKNKIFELATSEAVKEKGDWEMLQQKFTIPFQQKIEDLRIYVRSNGKGFFYFDDLKITEQATFQTDSSSTFRPDILQITISEKAIQKLEQKRTTALQIGVLESGDNDWVSGTLKSSETEGDMSVDLRLKGDWLDHLKGDKWSFRIQVKDPFAWRQMKTFSLHSPETRSFLEEWMLHEWWQKEDVLTTRYDFVEVQLNGKSLGVYAYEEHFEKQIPESNARREGVIVRFSEEGFWADVKKRLDDLEGNPLAHVNNSAYYSTAEVKAFKEKQVLKNPVLQQQLETAQNLLVDYLEQKRPPSEIFDVEKMAKYFAICDLMQAQHSVAWHNMRFYFNPVLNKLEPIGFDGFPTYDYPYLLMSEGALSHHFKENEEPIHYFFKDVDFLKQYIYNLFKFSEKDYLSNFLNQYEEGLAVRSEFIEREFKDYAIKKELLEKRISGIRSSILPFNNLTLKAYTENNFEGKKVVNLANSHSLPIQIIGTGFRDKEMSNPLDSLLILPAFVTSPFYKDQGNKKKKKAPKLTEIIRQKLEYQSITVNDNTKYIFYQVLGTDEIFHSKILDWQFPQASKNPPQLLSKDSTFSNSLYTVLDKKVIFHAGDWTIKEDLVFPKGFDIYFSEGTKIDLIQGAKFLSYSPIHMTGSADRPVKIYSSDQSANGFTVLQADEPSEMKFVIFENLNTHRKANWLLTGAVTFYESEVSMTDCVFTKNHCEDALNIIRSSFIIERSTFSQTFSDGLDLDFCQGSITDCVFQKTTNDGLDISGSQVYVVNCTMNGCGDKGISAGEQSNAVVLNASIKNAVIGVASKDLSEVTVDEIILEDCQQGFVAYQKKAEFGGSILRVKNYTANRVKRLYNVGAGCTLEIDNKKVER